MILITMILKVFTVRMVTVLMMMIFISLADYQVDPSDDDYVSSDFDYQVDPSDDDYV